MKDILGKINGIYWSRTMGYIGKTYGIHWVKTMGYTGQTLWDILWDILESN